MVPPRLAIVPPAFIYVKQWYRPMQAVVPLALITNYNWAQNESSIKSDDKVFASRKVEAMHRGRGHYALPLISSLSAAPQLGDGGLET
ncbi:hypothetical protein BHM03_00050645 [Ensete ventricosum]|nr:hypothetical protein BHM03_00050645 [Ensete ventricosum]